MNITQWLLAAAAVALISGTSTAMGQHDPPRTAPAEKVAPKSPSAGASTQALPGGKTRGALNSGAATPDRKKTALEHGEGHRTVSCRKIAASSTQSTTALSGGLR